MLYRQQSFLVSNESKPLPQGYKWAILLSILLLAALLRLFKFGQSPPGFNQDEAQSAWTAYCLLKTGRNYVGVHWPIFYTRGLGDNNPALYSYLLIPFQAIGGMNIFTSRLPAIVFGVFTVFLIYFVTKKLFDEKTGLLAAALLALNPWHIYQSRWGHEGSIVPLLGLLPLALMLCANMPLGNNRTLSPKPIVAVLAGALTGICCYGYQAVRIFVPVFLLMTALLTFTQFRQTIKTRKGLLAALAFIIGFAATFGPLLWQHIFHPEGIGRHMSFQPDWLGSAPLSVAVKNIALRYLRHFSLSEDNCYSTPRYLVPLMLAGLIIVFGKFKSSPSLRALLAFVLAYPAGDSVGWGENVLSINSYRSSPGLCSLIILAALGAAVSVRWLSKKNRTLTKVAALAFALAVGLWSINHFRYFYGRFNQHLEIYHEFHCDLVEACRWLRPRFDDFDAVFCTASGMNHPYIISLVILDYDPNRWFSEPRDFTTPGEFDFYTRYGKMHFMYDIDSFSSAISQIKYPEKTIFIVRPGELNLQNPIYRIKNPDGTDTLWICRP